MKYYGLISGLPVPRMGHQAVVEWRTLRSQITPFLSREDAESFHTFFYRIDLLNLEAFFYGQDRWIQVGNATEQVLRNVLENGAERTWSLLSGMELPSSGPLKVEVLHRCWQRYFDLQAKDAPEAVQHMLAFEISLRNFRAGVLASQLEPDAQAQYLEGGWFDRFAYGRLVLADIQAEYPELAAALTPLQTAADDREEKIREACWRYLEYAAFFDPFGFSGLFSLLLRYLDVHQFQRRDDERGAEVLNAFRHQLTTPIPEYSA